MRTHILILAFLFLRGIIFAQTYYKDIQLGEQNGVILSAEGIVSDEDFIKCGLKIDNTSKDFVLFYRDGCKYIVGGKEITPEKESAGKIVRPESKRKITVKVTGNNNYDESDIYFSPGGLYLFSSEGNVIETEDFHLPPNKNRFDNGAFEITMLKLKKETSETAVKFECEYKGDKIGIVDPVNCVLRTEEGKEWANVKVKTKPVIIQKGKKKSFAVVFQIPGKITDMQFAEMDIVWKNTFRESEPKKLTFREQKLEINNDKKKKGKKKK
ncbi:MAG: hypothetical protein GXO50_07520 [Chlorobi bacterium]|nr:hypothetical protein [Chlorobiota bacterium]